MKLEDHPPVQRIRPHHPLKGIPMKIGRQDIVKSKSALVAEKETR